MEKARDRIGIIPEPLNDWAGVAEALNAKRNSVGGMLGLNSPEIDEFFEHAESEAILDQCAMKQFHRLDGIARSGPRKFGLRYAQMR